MVGLPNKINRKRVIGLMVCGPEADRYLEASLKEFKRLCDDAIIATNNADEKTKKLIKAYGYWQYEDNREWGIHQPSIKTDLLEKIGKLNPDVILPIDADEIYDQTFTREEVENYSDLYPACYFYIVNLWNDEQHHRKALGFWNIRMFNYKPELGLVYQKKNLHCGLGPPWAYRLGSHVPHYILHRGLMTPQSRVDKIKRYEKFDPQARFKDRSYYEALKTETSGAEFNELTFKEELIEDCAKMGDQTKSMFQEKQPEEEVFLRRLKDGAKIPVPKRHVEETIKRGFILWKDDDDVIIKPPEIVKASTEFQCPICGREFKVKRTFDAHKKTH